MRESWEGEAQSLQPAVLLYRVVPAGLTFSVATGYLFFRVRSSRVFKWLLLQIYNCLNLTPRAQRNTFI